MLPALALLALSTRGALVLPEVRRHLADGWACLKGEPALARAHARAVLAEGDGLVEVDLGAVPADRRTACRAAVDGALEAWERAIGDGFRLRRADDRRRHAVVVRFLPDVRDEGRGVAGYIDWKHAAERQDADVQVRTVRPNGEPMSFRAMRGTVLHEFGHLLGLDDSDREGDAMGPLDPAHPVGEPTDAEASAVRAIRDEAERILRGAS